MRFKSIYFLLISILLLCIHSNSFAVSVIEVDQAKIRLSIVPGSAKAGSIKLNNPTSEPKHIKTYLQDWSYLPAFDGTKEFKPAGATALSAAGWISFAPNDFTISPFGKQIINYTVKVPQDAKGGHYSVMFFENYISDQNPPKEGVNVGVSIRIASLFYIEPEGTIIKDVGIEDLKVKKHEGGFEVAAKLVNRSNADIITKGSFFAMDKNGVVQARGEFNNVYMFGGDAAVLSGVWKESLLPGDYDLVISVDIGAGLTELGLGSGPVITKESKIHIDNEGNIEEGETK